MVAPDEEAQHGNGDAGEGDKTIAKNCLARKSADEFADHTHAGENHDVNGWVRVEPEKVLEENRVAAASGVKDTEIQDALREEQDHGDGEHWSAEDQDEASGVVPPDK